MALSYDVLGRQSSVNYPDTTPDIRKTYDVNGNLTALHRGSATNTYLYDSYDHLTSEQLAIDGRSYTTSYRYNGNEHLTGRTLPSGRRVGYAPNGLGQPTGLSSGGVDHASGATYHVNGALKYFRFGISGDVREFRSTLNERQLPARYDYTSSALWEYRYDALGRIASITDPLHHDGARTYDYDGLGRLVEADAPALWGAGRYRYDALGNIREKKLGSRVVTMSYDGQNRLSSFRDTKEKNILQKVRNDARGNVRRTGSVKGTGLEFVHDLSNQPVQMRGKRLTAEYVYDGNFRRVKQQINDRIFYSVYDASGALIHRDDVTKGRQTDYLSLGGHPVARITKGRLTSDVTWLLANHQGTPEIGLDSLGGHIYRDTLTPFGEHYGREHAASRNHAGFTGHVEDYQTGLVYMQARYYDPALGRFLSNDPVGFADSGFDPAYFNRYAYVANDPINNIDPDGRIALGLASKAFKILRKGGDIGATFAGAAADARTLTSGSATLGQRAGALVSLASEIASPVSLREGKAAVGAIKGAKGSAGGARAGKDFTPKGKREIDQNNIDTHGKPACENCGQDVVPGRQSQRGVTPPGNERQRDHIIPKSKGGDGSPENGQVLCRDCNLEKSDKLPD